MRNYLNLSILILVLLLGELGLAQTTRRRTTPKRERSRVQAPAENVSTAAKRVTTRRRPTRRTLKFLYLSGYYTSFADQVFVRTPAGKEKARSVFSSYGIGFDYTFYNYRYVYGWTLGLLSGSVDVQRVQNIMHPRRSFVGLQSGPEVGYRVNSDLDLSYSLGLLYRDIQSVGSSLALSNQINIKFRFSPRLTFFQNFGNYGKPTAYSYSIGLRWLL